MIGNIFSEVEKLRMGMDAAWKRAEVISNNIANNDTPGYDRQTVAFEDYYRAALAGEGDGSFAMKRTREKHMQGSDMRVPRIEVVVDEDTTMRMDGNNVDIDKEMTDLAETTIYYQTLQAKAASEISQLRTAITGSR